jgi:hypothetical protein
MYLNIDSKAGIAIGGALLFIGIALVYPGAVAGAIDTGTQTIADVLKQIANALSG